MQEGDKETRFDAFKSEWLSDVRAGNPSTVELGRRFAQKLAKHHFEIDDDSDDLWYCDGSADGGIDVAFFEEGGARQMADDVSVEGHTWYLVQSKYGKAFAGATTILTEGRKVIETLDGQRPSLSSIAEDLLGTLKAYLARISQHDRIVLVLGTVDALTDREKRALGDVRSIGRERLSDFFDVEAVSVRTLFERLEEQEQRPAEPGVRLNVTGDFAKSGERLLVGTIPLLGLYAMLKDYRDQTEDLDRLYEKNVRRFLGSRGKVNKFMFATLDTNPNVFGLYNNGITIVVDSFTLTDSGLVELKAPYIVNGCQTTRTVWDVCRRKLDAGGHGTSPELEQWEALATDGVVVAKIIEVGDRGDELLKDVTKYTNSQNSVKEKDFLGLETQFDQWSKAMRAQYEVFLETQRGGWESQKAFQARHLDDKRYTKHANAFELLRVYGAGWLGKPGTAYGRSAAFAPGAALYLQITGDETFGVDDLYAAYLLQSCADVYEFGRSSKKDSRRHTRFLFYMVAVELLRGILTRAQLAFDHQTVTLALISSLLDDRARSALLDSAADVIDEYFSRNEESSVFEEAAYLDEFNGNLNSYLKWEKLGESPSSPRLRDLITDMRRTMGRGNESNRSQAAIVLDAYTSRQTSVAGTS